MSRRVVVRPGGFFPFPSMFKTASFILALFIAVDATHAAEPTHALARTAQTAADLPTLTIAYLGGSLTSGSGASNAAKSSWRAQTTEWFRGRFPHVSVNEVNAGIGGTGSDLGVYRVAADVIAHRPDLVFVEFAVNDSAMAEGRRDSVTPAMDGIVRQIWTANPRADIVFIYTTRQTFEPFHQQGEKPPSVVLHQKVANHYRIPSIDVGAALWKEKQASGKDWAALLPDKVHPNDEGYAIYASAVRDFLEAQNWTRRSSEPVKLPPSMNPNAPEHGRFIEATAHVAEGWGVEEEPVGRFPRRLVSETSGAELKFRFKGNAIGVFWLSADDAGDVEWSVDGSPFTRRTSWSPHGGAKGRPYSAMFHDPVRGTALPEGDHVLTLRVAPEHDPRSKGNRVRIGAFIVNDPSH